MAQSDDEDWDEEYPDDDDDSATVPCPYCKREIHEDAERCPHCERISPKRNAGGTQAVVDCRGSRCLPVRRLPLDRALT